MIPEQYILSVHSRYHDHTEILLKRKVDNTLDLSIEWNVLYDRIIHTKCAEIILNVDFHHASIKGYQSVYHFNRCYKCGENFPEDIKAAAMIGVLNA